MDAPPSPANAAKDPANEKDDDVGFLRFAAAVLALIAAFAFAPRLFGQAQSPLAGKDAPDAPLTFVANPPEDAEPTLAALRGHPVLLDFWATWCGPCQMEAPIVDKIAQRHRADGLAVIGVNTSDESGNAARWAKSHGITYPIAFDSEQRVARAFGVENLPTLVILSKDGKVAAVRTGITSDAELEAIVKKVL